MGGRTIEVPIELLERVVNELDVLRNYRETCGEEPKIIEEGQKIEEELEAVLECES